jgi:hypothetical protein
VKPAHGAAGARRSSATLVETFPVDPLARAAAPTWRNQVLLIVADKADAAFARRHDLVMIVYFIHTYNKIILLYD